MPNRIAAEVAEASRLPETDLGKQSAGSYPNVLIDIANRLARLRRKAVKLRKELKTTGEGIKQAKKELRAVAQAIGRGKE